MGKIVINHVFGSMWGFVPPNYGDFGGWFIVVLPTFLNILVAPFLSCKLAVWMLSCLAGILHIYRHGSWKSVRVSSLDDAIEKNQAK